MEDALLVFNARRSRLRFTEFLLDPKGGLHRALEGQLDDLDLHGRFCANDPAGRIVAEHIWPEEQPPGHRLALAFLFNWLQHRGGGTRIVAVGHRVVHGGGAYEHPARVDAAMLERLEAYIPLAPLDQPHSLVPMRILAQRHPDMPQVACFETAFHRTMPTVEQAFALPEKITEWGVRRYGFFGLSCEYIASVLPQYDQRAAGGRTVIVRIGAETSMCALHSGRSIATTTGFTPNDGLPAGMCCGKLDPGVIQYLIDELGLTPRAIEIVLNRESGLLGVSGVSSDLRILLESDEPRARFAVELLAYHIGRELGSLVAALGGLDAVVFTAGIGESAASLRASICTDAAWLGVELDPVANASHGPRITRESSQVAAWVIPMDEELTIARHTQALTEITKEG